MIGAVVTSVVIAAMPLLGDVHLDGDAQGRGVLAWNGLQGSTFVAQATEVEAGRRVGPIHELWRTRANVVVEDVDVASSGAAAVCFRERPRRGGASSNAWRVRVVLRSAGGQWSRPILVTAPGRWVDDISCGVDDAGNAVLAWQEGLTRLRASAVSAGGAVSRPVTLARDPEPPDLEMSPDGAAALSFAVHRGDTRHLYMAEWLPEKGWSSVVEIPPRGEAVQGPELAVDGTGRRLLAWNGGPFDAIRLATGNGTALTTSTLAQSENIGLVSLTAGARGDVVVTYATHVTTGRKSTLRALVQRPGESFGAPFSLGPFAAYPLQSAVGADGSALVAWVGGSERRPHLVARSLAADGGWGPARPLSRTGQATGLEIGIAAGSTGRSTIAWSAGRFGNGRVQLRIAAL